MWRFDLQITWFRRKVETLINSRCPLLTESAAARPKLKLLPRTVKQPVNSAVVTDRNIAIFGAGKPRDGPDPELVVESQRARKESGSSNS